jgi:hypothetical protein
MVDIKQRELQAYGGLMARRDCWKMLYYCLENPDS